MSERMEFRDWSTDAVEKLRAQEVEIDRLRAAIVEHRKTRTAADLNLTTDVDRILWEVVPMPNDG